MTASAIGLNESAWLRCDELERDARRLGLGISRTSEGTRLIACDLPETRGMEVGRHLAEICLGCQGKVVVGDGVSVTIDNPVVACMGSQYAGWQVTEEKYFAMGSGPMRAAGSREPLLDELQIRERPNRVVGVLEARKPPPPEVCRHLAEECGVTPENLTLLAARTASHAGTIQVVARSVETALHKLHALGFDLWRITGGSGSAPLPPVPQEDAVAIGRTNDAILYGGEVTLMVRGNDASIEAIGPQTPSSASRDFGEPFSAIFDRYNRDFYKIDPLLFSPAVITLIGESGRVFRFGELRPDVLARSFAD